MAAARRLLEEGGPEAMTMRSIAAELGIRAASLYKHFPGKRSLEAAVIAVGLAELGEAIDTAVAASTRPIEAMARAYRAFGLAHPHLYRLMNDGELPRDLLPPGLEDAVAAPIVGALGGRVRARAGWALAHGLVSLELARRFPADADVDAVWNLAAAMLARPDAATLA